jgi:hypothetical protein
MVSQTIELQPRTKIDSAIPDTHIHGRILMTKVVGVTFENRQEVVAKLQMGDRVWLEREPANPYDFNAIKVSRNNGEQIGYINRHLATSLAPIMDRLNCSIRGKVYLLTGSIHDNYSLGVVVAFKLPKVKNHSQDDWDDEE